MKSGIAVAGSILVDKLNEISAYPEEGELAQIRKTGLSAGGCVPNVAIGLKKISPDLAVYAVGVTGDDEEGKYVLGCLKNNGVDTGYVSVNEGRTSFTEVMSVSGGQRTFFTYAGASAAFGYEDVPFGTLNAEMLHLGYFLLLDKVDGGDGIRILRSAQERGMKTSIDLVSENTCRYAQVLPCLKYTDNLIINETEAGKLAGISPEPENMRAVCEKLKKYGVRERVIIHSPEYGVCFGESGFTLVPSYDLPQGFIQGTTGAGDAFCSGALTAIYEKKSDEEILKFASACAVAALSAVDATSGLNCKKKILERCKGLKRKEICW
ncbi:MAG: carbohydrate kinase family protein [Candidatus Scatosoma sp.]